jgi:hypothetical protein
MLDNTLLCKDQLQLGVEARTKYLKDLQEWKEKRERLYKTEQELINELDDLDEAMIKLPLTGTYEVSKKGCATGWNETNCWQTCFNEYTGVNTPWKNNKVRFFPNVTPTNNCLGKINERQCHCLYQKNRDDLGMTKKIKKLLETQADIKNHEDNEFPKPAEINVLCCENELGCSGGRCYGNVQTCNTIVSNLDKKQDEPSILKNIENIDFQINNLIDNININTEYFDKFYNNFINFNYSKNYKSVYQQFINLYDNLTNYYNQIYKDTDSILRFISYVKIYDSRILITSPLSYQKKKSAEILKKLDDTTFNTITDSFRTLLEKYVEIKDVYIIFKDENENYTTMVKNKKEIDENMIIINKKVDEIIEEFTKIENFDIIYDFDKQNIIGQYRLIMNINNNIKEYLDKSKFFINKSELTLYTFRDISCASSPLPCSLYYDAAVKIFNDSYDIIQKMEEKYKETTEIVNKSKNIYLLKIDTYERNKQLNYDETLLAAFEEQERERERIQLEIELALQKLIEQEKLELEIKMEQESLLKKFIEEENNNNIDSNILDTNSNVVAGTDNNVKGTNNKVKGTDNIVPGTDNIVPGTDNIVPTNSDVITTNNGLSQIDISLIIGGIALFLIIIIKIISNKQIKNST